MITKARERTLFTVRLEKINGNVDIMIAGAERLASFFKWLNEEVSIEFTVIMCGSSL